MLLTTSDRAREEVACDWLSRSMARELCMLTLHMPALRERDVLSRRAQLLARIDGKGFTTEALDLLDHHPWWGEEQEIERLARVLTHMPGRLIDVSMVRTVMPDLHARQRARSLRVLLAPSRQPDGRITGFERVIEEGALLIGRARRVAQLEEAAKTGDQRATHWLDWLRARQPLRAITCLDFGLVPQLSRAQALCWSEGGSLRAEPLPHTQLRVLAGPLLQPLELLSPGQPIDLGSAAELRFEGLGGEVFLQNFLFCGDVAFEQHAAHAAARAWDHRDAPMAHTLSPHQRSSQTSPPRVWQMNPREAALLADLLTSFGGGPFNAHARAFAASLGAAEAPARLVSFLSSAPRCAQYVSRLIAHNDALMTPLFDERVRALPQSVDLCATLPASIVRVLGRSP